MGIGKPDKSVWNLRVQADQLQDQFSVSVSRAHFRCTVILHNAGRCSEKLLRFCPICAQNGSSLRSVWDLHSKLLKIAVSLEPLCANQSKSRAAQFQCNVIHHSSALHCCGNLHTFSLPCCWLSVFNIIRQTKEPAAQSW